MARLFMVSIKDKVTGEFLSPIYVHNNEEAARIFKYQLETVELWKDNKEQFEMYKLASFDTTTGNLNGVIPEPETSEILTLHPEMIFKGTDIVS